MKEFGAINLDRLGRVSTRGQVNHVAWRAAIAGGNWNEGVHNGARTLNTNDNPWNANGNIGVRGVSDALRVLKALCRFYVKVSRNRRLRESKGISRPILAALSVEHQKMHAHRDIKPCACPFFHG